MVVDNIKNANKDNNEAYIGKIVTAKIDRKMGSKHPKYGFIYPINYGYIPNTISGDGEELDCYILGVFEPIENFTGKCIAVIHRLNDDDDKLVLAPEDKEYTKDEIKALTEFQERFFKSAIIDVKKLNVILVYNKEESKILMCKREKEPYKGKFNLVGGKVEQNEDEFHAAYRELYEETGITNNDITLTHLMNFQYKLINMELEVFAGTLNKEVNLIEEVNKLYWIDKNENFFDMDKYAGEGNIGLMLKQVELNKDKIK
jgi:inorganic pyrophosphatase